MRASPIHAGICIAQLVSTTPVFADIKETPMRRACALLLPVLFSVACGGEGGGSSLTGPSNQIPDVAGSYSGTTTFNFPELGRTVTCQTTTSVTQSGSRVSVAPLQMRPGASECAGMSNAIRGRDH